LVCFVKILPQYGGSLFELAIHGGEGGCPVGCQRHWCFVFASQWKNVPEHEWWCGIEEKDSFS
jgi:hypothetical protein